MANFSIAFYFLYSKKERLNKLKGYTNKDLFSIVLASVSSTSEFLLQVCSQSWSHLKDNRLNRFWNTQALKIFCHNRLQKLNFFKK